VFTGEFRHAIDGKGRVAVPARFRAELATGVAAELKPERAGAVFYDLACFRALAGDRKGALASLRAAVEKGFRDVTLVETDPDLASLRGEKSYLAIIGELKKPTN